MALKRDVTPGPILEVINSGYLLAEPKTLRTVLELGALAGIENQERWLLRVLSFRNTDHKPLTEAQFLVLAPYLKIDFGNPQSQFLEKLLQINRNAQQRNFGKNLPALRVAFLHLISAILPLPPVFPSIGSGGRIFSL